MWLTHLDELKHSLRRFALLELNQIEQGVRTMPLRCIMISPDFNEVHRIEAIREKFDPLFGIVKPHITLVFPFGSNLTKDELHTQLSSTLSAFKPFQLVIRGVSVHRQPDGHYLFLNVTKGEAEIRRISGCLYEGVLMKYKSVRYDTTYVPHITLGRFPDEEALQSALKQIGDFSHEFSTTVRSVDVEAIGDDGSSTIEMSIPFPIST